jgi:hypothetical protein
MAGDSGIGLSPSRYGLILPARAAERAVIQRSPVQGNSPNARKDYPDFKASPESLLRCPPTHSTTRTVARQECAPAGEPQARNLAFFQARRNLSVRCGPKSKSKPSKPEGAVPPSVGRPASLGQRRDGRSVPCLIVRDEFRTGYSSIGLLASRARLRFTGSPSITCTFPSIRQKGTFLLCQQGGHFYFALTLLEIPLACLAAFALP